MIITFSFSTYLSFLCTWVPFFVNCDRLAWLNKYFFFFLNEWPSHPSHCKLCDLKLGSSSVSLPNVSWTIKVLHDRLSAILNSLLNRKVSSWFRPFELPPSIECRGSWTQNRLLRLSFSWWLFLVPSDSTFPFLLLQSPSVISIPFPRPPHFPSCSSSRSFHFPSLSESLSLPWSSSLTSPSSVSVYLCLSPLLFPQMSSDSLTVAVSPFFSPPFLLPPLPRRLFLPLSISFLPARITFVLSFVSFLLFPAFWNISAHSGLSNHPRILPTIHLSS